MKNSLKIFIFTILCVVMTGCGKETEDVQTNIVQETVVSTMESELEEETVLETIEEEENGIPKGIDLESTLSGEEWEMRFSIITNENLPALLPVNEVVIPEGGILIQHFREKSGWRHLL